MRLASTLIFGLFVACGGDGKNTTSGDTHDGTHGTSADGTHGTHATTEPATGGTGGGTGTTTQGTTTHGGTGASTTDDPGTTTHGSTTHDHGTTTTHGTTTHDHGSTGGAANEWWLTCGDPVCGGHVDQGLPTCKDLIEEGAACGVPGEQCDPVNDCNAVFVCAADDPKQDGCPISRARFKRDIEYLDAGDLRRLHDDLKKIRLATYHYRDVEPAVDKLGMILEDGPDGPWIDGGRDRVDLYAYTSLAIAALQVQAEQIAALRRELDELRGQQCRP